MDRWWVCSKYTVGALALHLPVNISRAWCNSGVLHCPWLPSGWWCSLRKPPSFVDSDSGPPIHVHLSTTLLLLKQLHVTRSLSATSFVTCEPLEMPTRQSSFSLPCLLPFTPFFPPMLILLCVACLFSGIPWQGSLKVPTFPTFFLFLCSKICLCLFALLL